MENKSYKDLIVWQKSIDLTEQVYEMVKLFPDDERYVLSTQMRRAAISIPSNIAEGQQRNSTKEFINFLYIAKGSKAELQTQCYICLRLNLLKKEQVKPVMELLAEIGKMITKLIESLRDE